MITMNSGEIEQMLQCGRIGRLAMADAAGQPYVIPLPFTWHAGSLYLRLPMTGRKGRVFLQNTRVCFEVDQFTDTLDEYASVLVEGRLEAVRDVAEKQQVREITRTKYQSLRRGYRPAHGRATPIDEMPLCRIAIDQISGRRREPERA